MRIIGPFAVSCLVALAAGACGSSSSPDAAPSTIDSAATIDAATTRVPIRAPRRCGATPQPPLRCGVRELDLEAFLEHPGRTFSRKDLDDRRGGYRLRREGRAPR